MKKPYNAVQHFLPGVRLQFSKQFFTHLLGLRDNLLITVLHSARPSTQLQQLPFIFTSL